MVYRSIRLEVAHEKRDFGLWKRWAEASTAIGSRGHTTRCVAVAQVVKQLCFGWEGGITKSAPHDTHGRMRGHKTNTRRRNKEVNWYKSQAWLVKKGSFVVAPSFPRRRHRWPCPCSWGIEKKKVLPAFCVW